METPAQTIHRLVSSLETLTREEHHLLDQGLFEDALAVQAREIPLVERIATLMVTPGVAAALAPALQERVQALLDAQLHQLRRLSEQKAAVRAQLQLLDQAQLRATRLKPAYGSGSTQAAPGSLRGEA